MAIVESYRPRWTDDGAWRIGDLLLDLGAEGGPAATEFDGIAGAARLSDDRLVVADAGSGEIRIFDTSGAIVATTGRRGSGPGEFQRIAGLGIGPADSIWVYDFGARRFSILSPHDHFIRSVTLDGTLSNVGAVGWLPDGTFVVREYWSSHVAGSGPRTGLQRHPAAVARIASDGSVLDTIALIPGREIFVGTEDGRMVMSSPPFARTASGAVLGSTVIVGDQEEFALTRLAADGTVRGILRVPGVDLSITNADVVAFVDAQVAARPAEEDAIRAHFAAMQAPPTRPAYGALLTDVEGNLWVGAFEATSETPAHWWVFGTDGGLLGSIRMPARFQPYAVDARWVLGVWRDALDVEHVRLYAVVDGHE